MVTEYAKRINWIQYSESWALVGILHISSGYISGHRWRFPFHHQFEYLVGCYRHNYFVFIPICFKFFFINIFISGFLVKLQVRLLSGMHCLCVSHSKRCYHMLIQFLVFGRRFFGTLFLGLSFIHRQILSQMKKCTKKSFGYSLLKYHQETRHCKTALKSTFKMSTTEVTGLERDMMSHQCILTYRPIVL